jgi:hypothetical protein
LPPNNDGDDESEDIMRDAIELAREADFSVGDKFATGSLDDLKHLVALVRADEREACAKVCEELLMWNEDDPGSSAAKAIRARGNT